MSSLVAHSIFCLNFIVRFEEDACKVGDNVISIIVILFFLLSRSYLKCTVHLSYIRIIFFYLILLTYAQVHKSIKWKMAFESKEHVKEVALHSSVANTVA